MDLLVTSIDDVTSDLLCEKIGRNVLRVNLEQSSDYNFEISDQQFKIEDYFDRYVNNKTLGKIIWRKPLHDVDPGLEEQWFSFHEFRYAIRAIINSVAIQRPEAVPINPFKLGAIDKFLQLEIAKDYFKVPSWVMTTQPDTVKLVGPVVVKSVSGSPVLGTGTSPKILFTKESQIEDLDAGWPWFIQSKIDANLDLTVVHVDGQNFAFSLDRNLFKGLDWRPYIGSESTNAWEPFILSVHHRAKINKFMKCLGIRYGRLDFLINHPLDEILIFLEVNANGQWAWLDMEQKNGLFEAMINFLFSSK